MAAPVLGTVSVNAGVVLLTEKEAGEIDADGPTAEAGAAEITTPMTEIEMAAMALRIFLNVMSPRYESA